MSCSTPLPDPRTLPPTLDIVTAGRLLGIGRTTAYQLARHGRFPVPVLRVGGSYRVPTAPMLALLGIDAPAVAAPQTTAA
ncbi:helix-turn-helix domain-containing protein [Actinocrinis puniceicyclus]|uniref:Helix-turn-helix domain-containing protein n=1 Tax=Actinocrinis puniceicyclus TaxID=977794 RepID=A0A8J7WPN5_9ACTN|nr:helix-turn-helix domain-containing protein [Actinocrinis puniceicyclus]MBS2966346.1 helix-turn-helix domain-containing protein [Actinocrinis puniceicyclus]